MNRTLKDSRPSEKLKFIWKPPFISWAAGPTPLSINPSPFPGSVAQQRPGEEAGGPGGRGEPAGSSAQAPSPEAYVSRNGADPGRWSNGRPPRPFPLKHRYAPSGGLTDLTSQRAGTASGPSCTSRVPSPRAAADAFRHRISAYGGGGTGGVRSCTSGSLPGYLQVRITRYHANSSWCETCLLLIKMSKTAYRIFHSVTTFTACRFPAWASQIGLS